MATLADAVELLAGSGICVSPKRQEALRQYQACVREWNRVVSLVSKGDLADLEGRHFVDSLSLGVLVREAAEGGGALLDIGSGAGFPALPLKIALPDVPVVMIERSERKVGFLRYVAGKLDLRDVEILCGEFPRVAPLPVGLAAVTARAVEKPERVVREVARWLPDGALFLCQAGDPRPWLEQMFHVEHVEDEWRARGLRRGELFTVQRLSDVPRGTME